MYLLTVFSTECANIQNIQSNVPVMGSVNYWTWKQGQMKSKLSVYQTRGMSILILDQHWNSSHVDIWDWKIFKLSITNYYVCNFPYVPWKFASTSLDVGWVCKTILLLTVHSQLIGYSIQSKYLLFFKMKPSLSIHWQVCIMYYWF